MSVWHTVEAFLLLLACLAMVKLVLLALGMSLIVAIWQKPDLLAIVFCLVCLFNVAIYFAF